MFFKTISIVIQIQYSKFSDILVYGLMMSYHHIYYRISMFFIDKRKKKQRGYFMAEHKAWFFLTGRSQRLLKQWACFSYVMKQGAFNCYLFIKSCMFSHNIDDISHMFKVLIQTNMSVSFALGQYFLMDIHRQQILK